MKSIPVVDGLNTKLKEICEKADYLNQKSGQLVEENRSLREEIVKLKQELDGKAAEIHDLNDQYQILMMAKSLGSNTDENVELKKRINDYIREIDQCLKLIGD